jgi:hypothetical protein
MNQSLLQTRIWVRQPTGPVLIITCLVAALPFAALNVPARASSLAPPCSGNGDSPDPAMSPDGRYVVFSNVAGGLLPGRLARPRTHRAQKAQLHALTEVCHQ